MTTTNQNQLTSATVTTPEIIEDVVHVLRTASGSAVLATTVNSIKHSQDTTLGEYLAGVESRLARIDVPATWAGLTGKPKVFPPADHKHEASDITDAPCVLSMPALAVDGKMALGKANSNRLTAGSYRLAPLDHFELTLTDKEGVATRVSVSAPVEGNTTDYLHTPTGTDGDVLTLTAISVDKLGNRSLPSPATTVTLVNAYVAAPGLLAPMNERAMVVGVEEPLNIVFISEPFRAVGLEDTHTASQYRVLNADGDTLYDSGETTDLASHTHALTDVAEGAVLRCSTRHRGERFDWSEWGAESRVSVVGKKFVTVGDAGAYSSSKDAIDWSFVDPFVPGMGNCNAIAYGNDTFVVCGSDGRISTSIDGITWSMSIEIHGDVRYWHSLAYGNGKFVVCGSDGMISTSIDGITWTTPVKTTGTYNSLYSIVYGNSMFVACGDKGKIATSVDGVT